MQLSLCDITYVPEADETDHLPLLTLALYYPIQSNKDQQIVPPSLKKLFIFIFYFICSLKISTECWKPKLTQKSPTENPFPFFLQAVDVLINSSNDTEMVTAISWDTEISALYNHTSPFNGIYCVIFQCLLDVILVIHTLTADVSGIH